jgi:hypothetical protein
MSKVGVAFGRLSRRSFYSGSSNALSIVPVLGDYYSTTLICLWVDGMEWKQPFMVLSRRARTQLREKRWKKKEE